MIILNAVCTFIIVEQNSEQEIIYRDLVNSYNDNISITEMSKIIYKKIHKSVMKILRGKKNILERLDYVKNYKEEHKTV